METQSNKINQTEKRISFMQYLNTVILTCIGIVTMIIFLTLNGIRNEQVEFGKELLRLKTVQDINVKNIENVDKRVTTLELNYLDYIKNWVDQNYQRKPQK
jgi:hypothetical protein